METKELIEKILQSENFNELKDKLSGATSNIKELFDYINKEKHLNDFVFRSATKTININVLKGYLGGAGIWLYDPILKMFICEVNKGEDDLTPRSEAHIERNVLDYLKKK